LAPYLTGFVRVSLLFNLDVSTIPDDETDGASTSARDVFISEVVVALSALTGRSLTLQGRRLSVDLSLVAVYPTADGKTEVVFDMAHAVFPSSQDLTNSVCAVFINGLSASAAAQSNPQAQVLNLLVPGGTTMYTGDTKTTFACPQFGPSPPPPSPPSTPPSGGSGLSVLLIIVIVVVVVVVVLAILGGGFWYLRIYKPKRLQSSTVVPAVGDRAVVQPPPLPEESPTPEPEAPRTFRDRVPLEPPTDS